jgi:hypothetical protein
MGDAGGLDDAFLQEYGWITGVDFEIWDGSGDDASGGSDGTVSEHGTGGEDREGAGPGAIVAGWGRSSGQSQGRSSWITGTEIRALREAAVVADADGGERVNPDALADPAVIADDEVPGVLHVDVVTDDDALTDARAEEAEKSDAESRRGEQVGAEEGRAE